MRKGFTVIEVTLFIAVSAFLFVGIAATASLNVSRQRYSNAVNDYVEFLKNLYSQVENVQNYHDPNDYHIGCTISSGATNQSFSTSNDTTNGNGRSNCAVYGKIAVFNQKPSSNSNSTNEIMVYDIIGDIVDNKHPLVANIGDTIDALRAVHAEYLSCDNVNGSYMLNYAGNTSFYLPSWSSRIEIIARNHNYFSGALLIVRSPIDGTIHTYILDLNDGTNDRITDVVSSRRTYASCSAALGAAKTGHADLAEYLTNNNAQRYRFRAEEVNFCVNSDDIFAYSGLRRNVRINLNPSDGDFGSDSSAVELVQLDVPSSANDPGGNKCL